MLNDLRFITQQPFLFSLGSNINNRTKDAHTGLNENSASRALYASALILQPLAYITVSLTVLPQSREKLSAVSASLMAAAFWGVFKQKEPADKQQSLS